MTARCRPNLVTLRTGDLEAALRKLPAVDPARADAVAIRVALPDRLVITLHEREPILVWETAEGGFLVDEAGVLFARRGVRARRCPRCRSCATTAARSTGSRVGAQLAASDLEAVRRLAALTPELPGQRRDEPRGARRRRRGLHPGRRAQGWHAVFGFYTPTLRPPTLIARQAQCLASLIAAGEARLATIYLAPGGDRCGTFTAQPAKTPAPSAKPTPAP